MVEAVSGPTPRETGDRALVYRAGSPAMVPLDSFSGVGVDAFSSRIEAQEADIPDPIQHIAVIHSGVVLDYVRDPAGTALVTGDGASWSPGELANSGVANVLAWGADPTGQTDSHAAIMAAIASGARIIYFPRGTYEIGDTIDITRVNCVLAGPDGGEAFIRHTGFAGSSLRFAPPDPLVGTNLFGCGLRNIAFIGQGLLDHWAVELIRTERFRMDNVRWYGHWKGLRVVGGQLNTLRRFQGMSPGSSGGADTSDTVHLRLEHAPTSSGFQRLDNLNVSDFFLSGSSANRPEHIIEVLQCDGATFVNGGIAHGNKSLIKLGPVGVANAVGVLKFSNVYIDGVGGTDTLVYAPDEPSLGDISVTFDSTCFFNWPANRHLDLQNDRLRTLTFDGCQFTQGASLGIVRGEAGSGVTGTRLMLNGVQLRSTGEGLTVEDVNIFSFQGGGCSNISDADGPIKLRGTIRQKRYGDNFFRSNAVDGIDDQSSGYQRPARMGDWHEVIPYTPALLIGSAAQSAAIEYSRQDGYAERIGNFCFFTARVTVTSKAGLEGSVRLVLPLPAAPGEDRYALSVRVNNVGSVTGDRMIMANTEGASASAPFFRMIAGGISGLLTEANIQDNFIFIVSGFYRV